MVADITEKMWDGFVSDFKKVILDANYDQLDGNFLETFVRNFDEDVIKQYEVSTIFV